MIRSFDEYTIRPVFEIWDESFPEEFDLRGYSIILNSMGYVSRGTVPEIFYDVVDSLNNMKFIGGEVSFDKEEVREAKINLKTFVAKVGPFVVISSDGGYELYDVFITWDKKTLKQKSFDFKKQEYIDY